MSVAMVSTSVTPAGGVAPSGLAVRWQTSARQQAVPDAVAVAASPAGTIPAAGLTLATTANGTATVPTSAKGSLLRGLVDGAADNLKSLVRTVTDKPLLSGAVVLGYHALILTPVAGLVTGGLAALGVISLATKGIAAVNAHDAGDHYGAGKALGSGLTDLGLTHVPKVLGRSRHLQSAADGVRAADGFADAGRVSQAVQGEVGVSKVAEQMIKSAKVAKRGAQWVTAARELVEPDRPPSQPDVA